MRIIVAGLYRSGSTWLFNVVRFICEEHGTVYSCFEDQYDQWESGKFDFEIVKAHKFDEIWIPGSVILTSIRPWKEVRKSMIRLRELNKTGNKTQHIRIPTFLEWLARWNNHNNYCMEFKDIYTRPLGVIKEVAAAISLDCEAKAIYEKVQALKPPKDGIDKVTLMHSNHITKYYSKKDFKKYQNHG